MRRNCVLGALFLLSIFSAVPGEGKLLTIRDYVEMEEEAWTVSHVQEALQIALAIEWATIPLYFTAYWSIDYQGQHLSQDQVEAAVHARELINPIIFEEMKHFQLAGNVLSAIGGHPSIATHLPAFPGSLPGGVHPEMYAQLGGLTVDYLKQYAMVVEYPTTGSLIAADNCCTERHPENCVQPDKGDRPCVHSIDALGDVTIGMFYTRIERALKFLHNRGWLKFDEDAKQLLTRFSRATFSEDVKPIRNLQDALDAIEVIKSEGEGDATSYIDVDGKLSHFYRFAELYHGKAIAKNEEGKLAYCGKDVVWPAVLNVPPIPKEGYKNVDGKTRELLDNFNQIYSDLVNDLEQAWNPHRKVALHDAVQDMISLAAAGKAVMERPLPGQPDAFYCPEFIDPIYYYVKTRTPNPLQGVVENVVVENVVVESAKEEL